MRTTLTAIGYTVLNVRYVSLVLPVAAFAYVAGRPAWLVVALAVLLALAVAAELVGSGINGLTAATQVRAQREYRADMWDKIERYANEAGSNGSEGEAGPSEGEATDEGEGGSAVPAK